MTRLRRRKAEPDLERMALQALKKLGTSRVGELAQVIFDNRFYRSRGSYSMPQEFYSLFEQYLSPGPLDKLSDDEFYSVAEIAFGQLAGRIEDALTFTASTRRKRTASLLTEFVVFAGGEAKLLGSPDVNTLVAYLGDELADFEEERGLSSAESTNLWREVNLWITETMKDRGF